MVPGSVLPSTGGQDLPERPLCGWLLKRKSASAGPARKLLGSTNLRFFTLDTVSRLFYYSRTESARTTSRPIHVRDISAVHSLVEERSRDETVLTSTSSQDACKAHLTHGDSDNSDDYDSAAWDLLKDNETISVNSMTTHGNGLATSSSAPQGKRASRLRRFRIPSFSRSKGSEQHGFVLHIKAPVERNMELLCTSSDEADRWIAAMDFAIRVAQAAQPQLVPLTCTAMLEFNSKTATVTNTDTANASDASSEIADWQSDISCR